MNPIGLTLRDSGRNIVDDVGHLTGILIRCMYTWRGMPNLGWALGWWGLAYDVTHLGLHSRGLPSHITESKGFTR